MTYTVDGSASAWWFTVYSANGTTVAQSGREWPSRGIAEYQAQLWIRVAVK